MERSKSTDKLLILKEIISNFPQHRIKSIIIDWKILVNEETGEDMHHPCLLIDLYEEKGLKTTEEVIDEVIEEIREK